MSIYFFVLVKFEEKKLRRYPLRISRAALWCFVTMIDR